jgi:hypothetical protein
MVTVHGMQDPRQPRVLSLRQLHAFYAGGASYMQMKPHHEVIRIPSNGLNRHFLSGIIGQLIKQLHTYAQYYLVPILRHIMGGRGAYGSCGGCEPGKP